MTDEDKVVLLKNANTFYYCFFCDNENIYLISVAYCTNLGLVVLLVTGNFSTLVLMECCYYMSREFFLKFSANSCAA